MTTEELLNKLSKKYPSPQYSFLSQVRNTTGLSQQVRTADALALSLWPSRGNHLIGFELKISRSDWLHEWKNPAKAEAIAQFCDMFYLVIADLSIVDISEVPKTWGIMVYSPTKKAVTTLREAPLLEALPISRSFLCGFMRNVDESISRQYTPAVEVTKIINDRVESEIKYRTSEFSRKAEAYDKLKENLEKFEKESGLDLVRLKYGWQDPIELGKVVNIVLNGGVKRIKEDLGYLKARAEGILGNINKELETLDKTENTIKS